MTNLFVSDLDDTLLSEGTLPPGTRACLKRIIDSGAHFTVATARGLRAAVAPLGDAIPRLPIIALGGAVVAYADGSEPAINGIASEAIIPIQRLVDHVGAAHCLLLTNGEDDVVFAPPRGDEFTDWSLDEAVYFKSHAVVRGRQPTDAERTRIVRLVICSTVQQTAMLEHSIESTHLSVSTVTIRSRDKPGFAWLEVGALTATKEHAVEYLASLLGYSMNDVVYYGDSANDLKAMMLAGEAIAVANADSDVLAVADRIIDDARTGAVVRDLKIRLGLGSNQGLINS